MTVAASLMGGAGIAGSLFNSIVRAQAIEPAGGSSYLDAEHVVILMQENRSFDHAFGTLRGVRGFNDPRAITLPDGNPVWVQANEAGQRYAPFRFDINASKITWLGSLPHGWTDQTDARNHGLHDKWLTAKRSGHHDYADMPLTLGYYTRGDIPFYYALADAFTVCDQYFCSSLTGTTPNRCYLWSGTIRERPSANVFANVRNSEVNDDSPASWPTFPERLEAHGVSWKVYQNELDIATGLNNEEYDWLANFSDNPLEWFTQYRVQLAANRRSYVERRIQQLPGEIDALAKQLATSNKKSDDVAKQQKRLKSLRSELAGLQAEQKRWSGKSLDQLTPHERALHEGAFTINTGDPNFRQLVEIAYRDGDAERRMQVPKGDVLHQFRTDVGSGKLPTVSWLVAPEKFSDHPSSAWYGAWYIAEVLDILTKNPDVWKKTIFILTYDENDGYFDHCPPFVAPNPFRPETGMVSRGIDAGVDYVQLEQDLKRKDAREARGGPIGLGYRVPMVIASPWSRGGCVYSQVSDHTSILQLMEKLLSHKLGKKVEESNISHWRRTVCGDLTASFQSAADAAGGKIKFPPRDEFLESIHRAQFKELPKGFHALNQDELAQIQRDAKSAALLPRQESGTRKSCPLPYQLFVDGSLNDAKTQFVMRFEAQNEMFGERAAGAPFIVHALGSKAKVTVRNYAVEPGESVEDTWMMTDFENGRYHLRVYGPNGFFREFIGGPDDPKIDLMLRYSRPFSNERKLTGDVEIVAKSRGRRADFQIQVHHNAYGSGSITKGMERDKPTIVGIRAQEYAGWYDLTVRVMGKNVFEKRYAGRVETGQWSTSDPAMA